MNTAYVVDVRLEGDVAGARAARKLRAARRHRVQHDDRRTLDKGSLRLVLPVHADPAVDERPAANRPGLEDAEAVGRERRRVRAVQGVETAGAPAECPVL